MARRRNILDEVMAEHIHLPGCPELVVTRAFAYDWLQKVGYSPSGRGFASLDYAVFHQRPTDEELSDLSYYGDFLNSVVASMNS